MSPSISFSPQIGTRQTVSVPSTSSSRAILSFTAVLGRGSYGELVRDNARLELWSNILGDGSEWREAVFQVACEKSLIEDDERITLHLKVSSPPQGTFGFTYRLVYPEGRVEWLGQFGSDGVLELESTDIGLVKGEGWSDRLWMSPNASNGTEIAKLTQDVSCFSIWSLNQDGQTWSDQQPTNASTVVCVRKSEEKLVACPPTLFLTASTGAFVSITPLGTVKLTGPPESTLRLHHYDSSSDLLAFVQGVFAHELGWRIIHADPTADCALIASPVGVMPATVLVIPVVAPHSPFPVEFSHTLFADTMGETSLVLCIKENDDLHFLEEASVITLSIPRNGASLTVAAFQSLGPDWKMALTTPNSPSTVPESENKLPTPPPSPQAKPTSRGFTIVPDDSVDDPSTGDITPLTTDGDSDSDSLKSLMESPTSAMARPRPTGRVSMARSVSFALTDTVIPISSRASLASTTPPVDPYYLEDDGSVMFYFRYLVHSASVFLRSVLDRVFGVFYIEGEDDKAWEVDESTPLLGEVVKEEESERPAFFEESVQVEEPERTLTEEEVPSRYFDVPCGKVTLLLQSTHEHPQVEKVDVELDGKPIERAVRVLAAFTRAFSVSVEVKESRGGKMRVFLKS